MTTDSGNSVLLTGATGFLGKVVLEHLIRNREALNLTKVFILIRPKKGSDSQTRFQQQIASSACFSLLPSSWTDIVEAIAGDVTAAHLGLDFTTHSILQAQVTHLIHCAGSVRFDLPISEAGKANVSSAMGLLAFARGCRNLRHLVHTSTAYVTPHRPGPLLETLAPLPRPAAELYEGMLTGTLPQSTPDLLQAANLPNTYTLSKSVAEHLLFEAVRKDKPPFNLTIVRPSIISAAWQSPFPGWIDSLSAFAGFLAAYGNGVLRVMNADPCTVLDIIPVDEVAGRLVHAAFGGGTVSYPSKAAAQPQTPIQILHATASLPTSLPIHTILTKSTAHLTENLPFPHRRPISTPFQPVAYLGPRNLHFAVCKFIYQDLPLWLAKTRSRIQGDGAQAREIQRVSSVLARLDAEFVYFLHRSFDFRASGALPPGFGGEEYLGVVLEGVRRHFLRGNPKPTSVKEPERRHVPSAWNLGLVLGPGLGPLKRVRTGLVRRAALTCGCIVLGLCVALALCA